jgi:hypothetical protein
MTDRKLLPARERLAIQAEIAALYGEGPRKGGKSDQALGDFFGFSQEGIRRARKSAIIGPSIARAVAEKLGLTIDQIVEKHAGDVPEVDPVELGIASALVLARPQNPILADEVAAATREHFATKPGVSPAVARAWFEERFAARITKDRGREQRRTASAATKAKLSEPRKPMHAPDKTARLRNHATSAAVGRRSGQTEDDGDV